MPGYKNYTHQPLGEEVESISGHYVAEREVRIPVEGREVVYIVGHAVVDTSCCGAGGCGYALVPGFVVRWKYASNDDGWDMTEVEPVRDDSAKAFIKKTIESVEPVTQVNFW